MSDSYLRPWAERDIADVQKYAERFGRMNHHELAGMMQALLRAQWHAYGVAVAHEWCVSIDVLNFENTDLTRTVGSLVSNPKRKPK